jgi:hypothetical protein
MLVLVVDEICNAKIKQFFISIVVVSDFVLDELGPLLLKVAFKRHFELAEKRSSVGPFETFSGSPELVKEGEKSFVVGAVAHNWHLHTRDLFASVVVPDLQGVFDVLDIVRVIFAHERNDGISMMRIHGKLDATNRFTAWTFPRNKRETKK